MAWVGTALVYCFSYGHGYEGSPNLFYVLCISPLRQLLWLFYDAGMTFLLFVASLENSPSAGVGKLLSIFLAQAALIVSVFLVPAFYPLYRSFVCGVVRRLETECNPGELSSWASGEIREHPSFHEEISRKECPNWIQNYFIRFVNVQEIAGQRYVWVEAGRYLGFEIGASELEPPPNKNIYRVRWKPGVFVWFITDGAE
jgi:hypothetical protein